MLIIDRYLLSQTLHRLFLALGVVLLALVLERILRLFEFAAENNAAFGLVLQMAANLVPHYLGLALPAAFFISILMLIARLGDDNELDAILGSGMSVARMSRTLILVGMLLSVLSVVLLGYIQPFSRYGYRAVKYAATHAVWNEAMSAQQFFAPARGVTIYVDGIDLVERSLEGVFINQRNRDGGETTTSAVQGRVEKNSETGDLQVLLTDVVQIIENPGKPPFALSLKSLTFKPDFPFQPPPFRARGDDQRELTLGQLWEMNTRPEPKGKPENAIDQAKVSAEMNGRLVRSLSVAIMPFLAVPMGMAAKRRRRGAAIATAAVLLVMYHYTLELGEGLVGLGVATPLVGLWIPLIIFSLFCVILFHRIDQRLRPNKFEWVFDVVDSGYQSVIGLFRRRKHPPT